MSDFYTPIPSLGLAYIGAVLLEDGFDVEAIDSFMACHTSEEMFKQIVAAAPDVLGVSLLPPCAPLLDPILPQLQAARPGLKIVLGNIHASAFDRHYLGNRLAHFIVHHEGEETMLELMQALRDHKSTHEIAGISYLDNESGEVVKTQKRPWIDRLTLDDMPYPAWELFPVEQFQPDIRLLGGYKADHIAEVQALPLLSSRGCPFSCKFCSPVNTIGNKYRLRSPKSIVDEMEHWHKKWGVTMFYCMDLTFPISESKGLKFCDHLIERNLPIRWACETRVSGVTLKLLERMKESGCSRVDYGIECGNQKMLDNIDKKFTIQQVCDAVKWTREAGIESEGLFIIGLPDEDPEDTQDTINFALDLDLDHIKLNLFVPYPGSEYWDRLVAKGEITNMDFSEYTSYPSYTGGTVAYVPAGRSHQELVDAQSRGMRHAMFRRRVIFRELRHLKLDKLRQYWHAVLSLLFPKGARHAGRPAGPTESDTIGAATYIPAPSPRTRTSTSPTDR